MKPWQPAAPLKAIRFAIFTLLLLGMAGTGTELVLLDHMEDRLQWVPLILLAIGLLSSAWHALRSSPASVRALQAIFFAFVAAGLAGVYFHYRGGVEFKLESNPALAGWDLFRQALLSKAPPVLAPGAMIQLGLLGLIYTYRHPVITKTAGENVKGTEGE
jgi:hypothetical protein